MTWKLSYFLGHHTRFFTGLAWELHQLCLPQTHIVPNQSDLQEEYKLWSFCNALLPNQFVFAKVALGHVKMERRPSEERVTIILSLAWNLFWAYLGFLMQSR